MGRLAKSALLFLQYVLRLFEPLQRTVLKNAVKSWFLEPLDYLNSDLP